MKWQHYKYLCSVGFAFERECKQYELLLNELTDIPSDDCFNQKSLGKCVHPLWWEMHTPICKEKVVDI